LGLATNFSFLKPCEQLYLKMGEKCTANLISDINFGFRACIITEHLRLRIQEKDGSIVSFKGEVCIPLHN